MPVRYCAAPCSTAKAPSRRCWWLCFGSCARRPGRVGSRPRGSPQWRASGATDADAVRHQVGARSSQMDQGTRRHAGYAATAVRPDGSRNPRSWLVPSPKSQLRRSQPCTGGRSCGINKWSAAVREQRDLLLRDSLLSPAAAARRGAEPEAPRVRFVSYGLCVRLKSGTASASGRVRYSYCRTSGVTTGFGELPIDATIPATLKRRQLPKLFFQSDHQPFQVDSEQLSSISEGNEKDTPQK